MYFKNKNVILQKNDHNLFFKDYQNDNQYQCHENHF